MENFLPGADNIFKYMITVGVALILFMVVYPLKKEQELQIASLDLDYRVSVLKNQMDELKEMDKKKTDLDYERNALSDSGEYTKKSDSISAIMNSLKRKIDSLSNYLSDTIVKLDFDNQKSGLLKKHAGSYLFLRIFLFSIGIILIVGGFIFWLSKTFVEEMVQGQSPSNTETALIKTIKWIAKNRLFSILIFITYILVVYILMKFI
ncbi:hypothetical protein [Sphingobacterium puteale]|uniref:hypothetical protein n=1 Tax=Sphingobacterium puteale TaxID=2420510 RepID=UPI003D970DEB